MRKNVQKLLSPDGIDPNTPDQAPAPNPDPATPPSKPAVVLDGSGKTVGEIALEYEELKKRGLLPADDSTPAPTPAPSPAPAATPPAAPPKPAPALRKKAEVAPPAPAPVVPPAPVAVTPPAVSPAPLPPVDPNEAYVKALPADIQEELEYLKIVEAKVPDIKGVTDKTIAFYKKLDDYAAANPDADMEAFIATNKPKLTSSQKRKADTAYLKEQITPTVNAAVETVRRDLEPKLQEANAKLRAQEAAPAIDKSVNEFSALLTSKDVLTSPEAEVIPDEVAKKIATDGYEAAVEQFPLEAPIVNSNLQTAREWLRLTSGVQQFNPQNPTHNFLVNLVNQQGRIYAQKPESTLGDGRKFLPLDDYLNVVTRAPQEVGKYYTFTDKEVMQLLAINASQGYNSEIKRLEKSGFTRAKKTTAPQTQTPAPTPSPVQGSPKMRQTIAPDTSPSPQNMTDASRFIESLVPGASKNLGL